MCRIGVETDLQAVSQARRSGLVAGAAEHVRDGHRVVPMQLLERHARREQGDHALLVHLQSVDARGAVAAAAVHHQRLARREALLFDELVYGEA